MEEFFETDIFTYGSLQITVGAVVISLAVLVIAWLLSFIVRKLLKRLLSDRSIEKGRQIAFLLIIKYLIYFFAFLVILKTFGIGLTGLLVGSSALLVGIGFGLQQTFNDFISGLILLFEGGVKVGDNLVVDNLECTVQRIGLRSTEVLTRDSIMIIVPNSIMVSNNVINWSHSKTPARFDISVGVAYSSNVDEVERLLLECAHEQHSVRNTPSPSVQITEFAESSIRFRLLFYSREYVMIERVKSDIRKRIFKKFAENNIVIPFPQREIWNRN